MITSRLASKKGFTLVELMIVIAIIAILAAIALPLATRYRIRAYNAAAIYDLKNIFLASQNHFSANVGVPVTLLNLETAGYSQTPNVVVDITDPSENSLQISTHHANGDITYTINSEGAITQ